MKNIKKALSFMLILALAFTMMPGISKAAGDKVTVIYKYSDINTGNKLKDDVNVEQNLGDDVEFSKYAVNIAGYEYVKNHSATKARGDSSGKMTIEMQYKKSGSTTGDKEVAVRFVYVEKGTTKELADSATEMHKEGEPLEIKKNVKTIDGYEYQKDHSSDEKAVYGTDGKMTVFMNYLPKGGATKDGKEIEVTYVYVEKGTTNEIFEKQVSKQKNGDELEITSFKKEIQGYDYVKDHPLGEKVVGNSDKKMTVTMNYKKNGKEIGEKKIVTFRYVDKDGKLLKEDKQEYKVGETIEIKKHIKPIDGYTYVGNNNNYVVQNKDNKIELQYEKRAGASTPTTNKDNGTVIENKSQKKAISLRRFLPKTGTQKGIAILVVGIIVVVAGTLLMRKKK